MEICSKYFDIISEFERVIEIELPSSSNPDIYYDVKVYPWLMNNSSCTCKGYQFRHKCSHIDQVYNNYFCDWSEGLEKERQVENGICPKCGSHTRDI